jgi:hypothetical protein
VIDNQNAGQKGQNIGKVTITTQERQQFDYSQKSQMVKTSVSPTRLVEDKETSSLEGSRPPASRSSWNAGSMKSGFANKEKQNENQTISNVEVKSIKSGTRLSVVERRAVFQHKSTPVYPDRKSDASLFVSTVRRPFEPERKLSRRNSFSLQDVLESRKNSVTIGSSSGESMPCIDSGVDTNIRPSELLKKVRANTPAAPPSPLLCRRGFSSTVTRASHIRETEIQSFRSLL